MTFEPYYISDDVVQSLSALGRQDRIKIAKQFNVSEEHVRLIVKSECKVNENSAKILAATKETNPLNQHNHGAASSG